MQGIFSWFIGEGLMRVYEEYSQIIASFLAILVIFVVIVGRGILKRIRSPKLLDAPKKKAREYVKGNIEEIK